MSRRVNARSSARKIVKYSLSLALLFVWLRMVAPGLGVHVQAFTDRPEQQTKSKEAEEVIILEPGKPIEWNLGAGQSPHYKIALKKGELMVLTIRYQGREVALKFSGPTGKAIDEVNDLEYFKQGKRVISHVAQLDGLHELILVPQQKSAAPEHDEVVLELGQPTAATEKDLALQEARTLTAEFFQLYRVGSFDEALAKAERALEIRMRVLGEENYIVGASLNRIAVCYSIKADYARVEPLYLRALAIFEKVLDPENFKFGDLYNNLGLLYYTTGDYEKAESFLRRGLAIREKALGPENTEVAASINNLAATFKEREMYEQAEPLYRRAIEIREKTIGADNPALVGPLSNLASCYGFRGDYEKAEKLHRRALALLDKIGAPYNPMYAYPLEGLAYIYSIKGEYEEAAAYYLRSLEIREKALGSYHPEVAANLTSLAALFTARGNIDRAVQYQSRANEIGEHNLALNLVIGSERQKLAFIALQTKQTDQTISLHLRYAPQNATAAKLAANAVLQHKGRALDAMADNVARLRLRASPQDRVLLDRLKQTVAQLSELVLNGPQKISTEEHQKQVDELEERKEKIEAEIGRNSSEFQSQTQRITVAAVQSSIPPGTALIEFAAYRPFNAAAKNTETSYGKSRYAAYIFRHEGQVEGLDLGEAEAIDAAVGRFREALRDPGRKDVKPRARTLDEKVMRPIRSHLGESTQLLISPDGELNLIPFAALVDERNRFLVERFSFTYLTSGRDLLRLRVAREKHGPPQVFADPAFGTLASRRPQSVTEGTELSSVYFPPLPGTAMEGQMIKALFPDALIHKGGQATEAALKRVDAPSILHIATHGFFLENSPLLADGRRGSSSASGQRGLNLGTRIENPLLRSGLALAGANLQRSKDDDGILTALEASGLNLWGTRLVVLSACDTGLGEVKNGDGVYGLRRALVLAGSKTQVMSLWPVSDYATRELMKAYYRGLKRGLGCGIALRQMQLKMLTTGRRHPFYWASFIQSGEWANLSGKR